MPVVTCGPASTSAIQALLSHGRCPLMPKPLPIESMVLLRPESSRESTFTQTVLGAVVEIQPCHASWLSKQQRIFMAKVGQCSAGRARPNFPPSNRADPSARARECHWPNDMCAGSGSRAYPAQTGTPRHSTHATRPANPGRLRQAASVAKVLAGFPRTRPTPAGT